MWIHSGYIDLTSGTSRGIKSIIADPSRYIELSLGQHPMKCIFPFLLRVLHEMAGIARQWI